MRKESIVDIDGVRCVPAVPRGVGALVLAGSSGRIDSERAAALARVGVLAESIRWFGGHGQPAGPWEIPLELFLERVTSLARECERVLVVGSSFGAEAALLTGALSPDVDGVVAFAPSDVVWGGVGPDGVALSHWSLGAKALPFVPLDDQWVQHEDPPAYVGLYRASRERFGDRLTDAAISVERIEQLILVAGGDDQVWPAVAMARCIVGRRELHGLQTTLVTDLDAGHRTLLPGQRVPSAGAQMRRGGTAAADRRLGTAAWSAIESLLPA